MSNSSNPTIQKLMDEVDALDENDTSLEAKLQLIAQKVAEEQRKVKATLTGQNITVEDDPADAFACEGCQ